MTTKTSPLQLPEIASRLHNGAWVLGVKDIGHNWAVVLGGHLSAGAAMPFCVWKVDLIDGSAYWGEYHDDIVEAVEAFEARA